MPAHTPDEQRRRAAGQPPAARFQAQTDVFPGPSGKVPKSAFDTTQKFLGGGREGRFGLGRGRGTKPQGGGRQPPGRIIPPYRPPIRQLPYQVRTPVERPVPLGLPEQFFGLPEPVEFSQTPQGQNMLRRILAQIGGGRRF